MNVIMFLLKFTFLLNIFGLELQLV